MVRISNTTLRNVARIQESSYSLVTSNLILHVDAGDTSSYPGSGTTWTDLRGNNNGTLTNGPTFNSANGGSISFDGTNDYASFGSFTGLGAKNRTFDIWFKYPTSQTGDNKRIVTFPKDDNFTDEPIFVLSYKAGATPQGFEVGVGGAPYNGYSTITAVVDTWHNYIVSVTANSSYSWYINGVLHTNKTGITGTVATNAIGYIGRYNNNYGQYSKVDVAILRVYDRALTSSEANQNFQTNRARFNL